MGRNLRLLTVLLPLLLSLPTSAWAKGDLYDLEFNRLVNQTKIDQNGFNHVVRDMAIAMAPQFLGPAATLGSLGFEIAYEMSWTDIVEDSDHWQTVIGDGQQPDSALTTMFGCHVLGDLACRGVRARKRGRGNRAYFSPTPFLRYIISIHLYL